MLVRGEETLNFSEQAVRKMTLVDERIGAMAATLVGKRKAIEFRKNDHPQVRTGEADLLSGLQSVDPRHAEIEKDKVRLTSGCELHCILAVASSPHDLKTAGEFEVITHRAKRCGGIVGDQDANTFRRVMHAFQTKLMKEVCGNPGEMDMEGSP